MILAEITHSWTRLFYGLVDYFLNMPVFFWLIFTEFVCSSVVIAFACHARRWVLAIGLAATLPFSMTTLTILISAWEWNPPVFVKLANQVLALPGLVLATGSIIAELRRAAKSRYYPPNEPQA